MVASNLSASLAIAAGFLTILSPCVLPIVPLIIGRSLQSHRYGPVALVLGLISGFAVTGSLLGITASWFAGLASALRVVAIALLLIAGVLAIFPNWSYRLFSYLRLTNWVKEPTRVGLMGEFWLGSQLGLLWTPCAGPVLASILVLAAVQHNAVHAFMLLVLYGLGAGLPLLVIAYGGRYLSKRLLSLRLHATVLQRVGGVIVVATAIAILLGWDVQIQLWLAPIFPRLPFSILFLRI
jgi:cytochrome c biogenesis protein CcdA